MKKLAVASAVIAALTSFASAATDYEVSHGNNKETTFKIYHPVVAGFNAGFEIVGAKNLKHHKETTFTVDYKVDMGQAYIMPSFDLTIPSGYSKEYKKESAAMPGAVDESVNYKDSNVAKFGLKGGYDFGNGLYTAARYRYEISDGKGEYRYSDFEIAQTGSVKQKSKLHRFDLTVGYNLMDTVDLSANYIIKRGKLNGNVDIQDSEFGSVKPNGKVKANSQELELKATLTSLGQLKPYAQYTYKGKTTEKYSVDGVGHIGSEKYKNDNVFKIGVQYSF